MLGARIAALRRQANLSQSELAEQLRISPSAVGMYEQGRREPSVDTLVAMSRIFRVSLDFLLTGQVPPQERQTISELLRDRVDALDTHLEKRDKRPYSRQELAVLFAAMLIE